jgi:hypothetical protein
MVDGGEVLKHDVLSKGRFGVSAFEDPRMTEEADWKQKHIKFAKEAGCGCVRLVS